MLLITGLIISFQGSKWDKKFIVRNATVGFLFALATFMQPRWILITAVVAIVWSFFFSEPKKKALLILIVMGVMSVAPLVLIQRNMESIGKTAISTNLGATMRLGAGESTSGGYLHSGPDVPCESKRGVAAPTDNELVKCVISWYLENPGKGVALFVKKGWYFWSPWSGPFANGTMARNPYLEISPFSLLAKSGQTGKDLTYGFIGKAISSVWVLTSLFLLAVGFVLLYREKSISRLIGFLGLMPIAASWMISMGTIGDHRFRLPTMGLSLFLQAVGAHELWNRRKSKIASEIRR
jgi:hypothetical protein